MSDKVLAIVQARMGSTRLPGKVLRDIAGKPLLWHILHRLGKCRRVDEIVVATSTHKDDDEIERYCGKCSVPVIRGDESNVLSRFEKAVAVVDPSLIIRVNADAPLIDPAFIDHMITPVQAGDADTAFGPAGVPCAHDGVDPISRKAFDRLVAKASDDPVAQEHVTGFLKANPSFSRIANLDIEPALQVDGIRLSIDTQADVRLIEQLYIRSGAPAGDLDLREALALLQADPSLRAINSHVRQKSVAQESGLVVMRCDGGPDIGFGHVMRSLAVARALRDVQGLGVIFAMRPDGPANRRVVEDGFEVETWPENQTEENWLRGILRDKRPRAVVLDIRTGLSRPSLHRLKQDVDLTVLLDDGSPRRLAADMVVYPPVPQVQDLDWIGFTGEKQVGWEWIILPHASELAPTRTQNNTVPKVLVTMGGSDPLKLTWDVACLLREMRTEVDPVFVIGPGFGDADLLHKRLNGLLPSARVLRQPKSLADVYAEVDFAITMYGVTAQELAAAGVPSAYICLDDDHCDSARSLTERGVGVTLGLGDDFDATHVAKELSSLLADPDERALMSKRGPRLIDGKGADRLAAKIVERLAKRAAA